MRKTNNGPINLYKENIRPIRAAGFLLQSDVIRKPQGQIEVNASSSIARGDGKQVLQVMERPPEAGGGPGIDNLTLDAPAGLPGAGGDGEERVLPEGRLSQPAGRVAAGAAQRPQGEGRQPPLHPAGPPARHEGAARQGPSHTCILHTSEH